MTNSKSAKIGFEKELWRAADAFEEQYQKLPALASFLAFPSIKESAHRPYTHP
ncbi:MAG: hypothetical protein GX294_07760 [Candidatus Cloacimonetes bacterium]|nr:hypothetical protein [Candidatus Cloacimonadota bacterium]